jgi:hypothetical protein
MATARTKCISTKVTDEEYVLLTRVARGHTVSAWAHDTLLAAAQSEPADQVILAELLALRAIVLTLQFAVAKGETVTSELMHHLVERADATKRERARALTHPVAGTRA